MVKAVANNCGWTCIPEVLEVFLDIREQRVLQRLNKLSVYFLRNQFCSSTVCKYQPQSKLAMLQSVPNCEIMSCASILSLHFARF